MNPLKLLDRRVASAFYGQLPDLRPAQEAAIEPLVTGQNIVLSSGTGSGKTEAVVAPLLSRFWRTASETDSLTILYIAPTKALVNDLEKRLHPLLSSLGLRVGVRHGDRDDLTSKAKPHLLITTPESLDVLLFRKDDSLTTIGAVIIDEVHLLYNTQRGLHLSILLQRLKQLLSNELQWAALSATVGNLSNVRDFLFSSENNAVFLQFPSHRAIDAKVLHIPSEQAFLELIKKLVEGSKKLLLFANSRKECDRLAGILNQDDRLRKNVFVHYSSLSPEIRVETEHEFSASRAGVCIATSTLELGIDIGDIDAVLLWGVPGSVESFLQRVGRGNRRQKKTNVICLIPDQTVEVVGDAVRFLTLIDAAENGEFPIRSPYHLFGGVGQQLLNVIASESGRFTRVADLCKLIEHKDYLDRPSADKILAELAGKGYLKRHGFKNQFGADESLYRLQDYRMIYGNFPAASQAVDVSYRSKLLGSVPAINLLRLRRGNVIDFAGKRWRIRSASADGIFLEPSHSSESSANFIYPGAGLGFDPFLAGKMWNLLHRDSSSLNILSASLRQSVNKAKIQLQNICNSKQIPFTRTPQGICYFTFAGYLTNKALALISKQIYFKADDISLLVNSPIDWKTISTDPQEYSVIFNDLFEVSSEQSIFQTLLPSEFQVREYLQDWLRDESVENSLARLANSVEVKILPSDCELLVCKTD